MRPGAESAVNDWMLWLLAAVGVNYPPRDFLGGLFLALAAAALARHWMPVRNRGELWAAALSALVVATIAGEVAALKFPEAPVQMVMAAGGFISVYLVRFAGSALGLVEKRAEVITDRVLDRVLPGDRGDGEDGGGQR